jgi:chemotaxis protein MotB
MRHIFGVSGMGGMGAVLVLVLATGATGCLCEEERQAIAALQTDKERLTVQNREYRDQISGLEKQNADLKAEFDDQIAKKNETIALLEKELEGGGKAPSGWEEGHYGSKVTVGSDVLFSSGQATLTNSGKAALDRVAADLKNSFAGRKVLVYGYTDSDPIKKTKNLWQDNLDLSANRAMAVTRYLISRGVGKDDIETVAMGDTHFVAGNASRTDKAKNRRVVIFVLKAEK